MGIGWERENRTHFDEIVAGYDRIRPEYPAALLSDVFEYAQADVRKKALEIGAGTGKATKSFLAAGYDVTAVEIGANMAAFLQERFGECGNFSVINESFEEAALENGAYDLIYAATSFHWVEAEIGCPKALRLLRDGGAFALFRYNAVPADGDALYEEIQAVYKMYYHKPYVKPVRMSKEDYTTPAAIYKGFRFDGMEQYGFEDVTMKLYDAARTFTANEYIEILETFADHRALADGDRAALYAGVKKAIIKHGGQITMEYVFQLYMGKKRN